MENNLKKSMNIKDVAFWLTAVGVIGICGCVTIGRHSGEEAEAGETKVRLEETPAAARQTIERELVGAQLEDIARKMRQGKTVYETDIIRGGHKWEVVVGEDGQILSKIQEGGRGEEKAEKEGSAK